MDEATWEFAKQRYRVGQLVTGTVVDRQHYGVFVELAPGIVGLVEHIEFRDEPKKQSFPEDYPDVGQKVEVVVVWFSNLDCRIWLSMRPRLIELAKTELDGAVVDWPSVLRSRFDRRKSHS
jgi:ribosomal protein S1